MAVRSRKGLSGTSEARRGLQGFLWDSSLEKGGGMSDRQILEGLSIHEAWIIENLFCLKTRTSEPDELNMTK